MTFADDALIFIRRARDQKAGGGKVQVRGSRTDFVRLNEMETGGEAEDVEEFKRVEVNRSREKDQNKRGVGAGSFRDDLRQTAVNFSFHYYGCFDMWLGDGCTYIT